EFVLAADRKVATERVEVEMPAFRLQLFEYEGTGKRGEATQGNFHRRREPAQVPAFPLRYQKGGLGQVVLGGNVFQHVIRQPAVEEADAGRVAVKQLGGEGVDYVERYGHWRSPCIPCSLE